MPPPLYFASQNTEEEFKCTVLPFAGNTERAFKRRVRRNLFTFLPCVVERYRGETSGHSSRGEGLKKITASVSGRGKPPLSGREGACRRRNRGEDCLSEASSAAPDGGSSDRANKPDNSGGASWFVLLAAEKNEQIEIHTSPLCHEVI